MKTKLNNKNNFIALMLLLIAGVLVSLVVLSNHFIEKSTSSYVYDDIKNIPTNKVGLILGTSKLTRDNRYNLYFKYRISAAEHLYKTGKISKILVSGDNGHKGYDEPTDIKNELINVGIPSSDIYLDYAGFRTLDSVVRAKKIFGLNEITVISQKFHNQRAIFIAKNNSIKAIGFNAKDVLGSGAIKTNVREKIARFKTILDIYVLNTKPKFLGETIKII